MPTSKSSEPASTEKQCQNILVNRIEKMKQHPAVIASDVRTCFFQLTKQGATLFTSLKNNKIVYNYQLFFLLVFKLITYIDFLTTIN